MASKELRAALRAPFPPDKVYQREGPARKKLDYVAIETVLNRLLDATKDEDAGYAWQVTYCFTEKNGETWSAVVAGNLMIGGDMGGGVGSMTNRDLDMAVKSANSEAIKNAAKNGFGVGLELWDAEYRAQLDQRRRAAGGSEQALKALVFDIAKQRLDTTKPSLAQIAELFNVDAGDLSDAESLAAILEAEGVL